MPQLPRASWWPHFTAPQTEVWAVSKQTLSWDEATTLVAQLESGESGVGRTVMGPTTPWKQRAGPQAAALERISRVAKTENLALQRWDKARPGLLAAYGLNDQLVSKLALKAEG